MDGVEKVVNNDDWFRYLAENDLLLYEETEKISKSGLQRVTECRKPMLMGFSSRF